MKRKGKQKSSVPCKYGHTFVTTTSDMYMACLYCPVVIKVEEYRELKAREEARKSENAK